MRKSTMTLVCAALLLSSAASLDALSLGGPSSGQQLAGALLFLLLVVCMQSGLLAAALIYAVLDPQRVQDGSRLQRQAPWQSFRTGVLALIVLLLFAFFFSHLHPPKVLALLVWVPLVFGLAYLLLIGFTMTAHGIGERIQSNLNSRAVGSTFMAVLFGGAVLLGVTFLPLFGLVLLVVAGLVSLGTAARTVAGRDAARSSTASAPDAPPPVA
jgi:hypothetical protein